MLKSLSRYSETQLTYLLERVREIAALGDEAALIETDKMVWEIMEEEGGLDDIVDTSALPPPQGGEDHTEWQRNYDQGQRFYHVQYVLRQVQKAIEDHSIDFWDLSRLKSAVIHQDHRDFNGSEDQEWEKVKAEGGALLDDAYEMVMNKVLDRASSRQFKNIASVGAMIDHIDRVTEGCADVRPLTDEYAQRVRAAKERGARFRWGKKIADAEVAEAAGFMGKATSLRREAVALLVQDWAMVFDGEKPPVNTV